MRLTSDFVVGTLVRVQYGSPPAAEKTYLTRAADHGAKARSKDVDASRRDLNSVRAFKGGARG